MEGEQLSGDEISPDTSQLNPEIGREEGQGSWDELEIEPEEDSTAEVEVGQESGKKPEDTGHDSPGESGVEGVDGIEDPEEEEETEQKNTLSDSSPRVLSFKDFFGKN
jgi:hypothetical protein